MFLNDSLAETKWWIELGLLSCHVIQLVGFSVQTVKIIAVHGTSRPREQTPLQVSEDSREKLTLAVPTPYLNDM